MSHAILAVALQVLVGLTTRRWLLGGLLAVSFYVGREVTQAEYRWITQFGEGTRANLPWWGAFDPVVWNSKSLLDVALPAAAVVAVYLLSQRWR